ncbi:AMP-binding protein [Dehalococcoidia bacterium]|nr:AMP-binding protein [Dehalococcoidia bacterium]
MNEYLRENFVLGQLLAEKAKEHGSKTFLRFPTKELTYRELDDMSNRVAQGLRHIGVARGTHVAVMLPNCPEFVHVTFALAKIGAVAVPINTEYKGEMLSHVINSSESTIFIVDGRWLDRVEVIASTIGDIAKFVVKDLSSSVLTDFRAETIPFEILLGAGVGPSEEVVHHNDLQAIMYTSGTTGPSKGVMVSHAQACTLAYEWCRFVDYRPEDSIYSPLPLFHGIAHTCGVVAALLMGSTISITERFSASRFWDDVRWSEATIGHGIFSMFQILLNMPPHPNDKDHTLRCVWLGQSSMDQAFTERFGTRIVETYGSTEVGIATGSTYGNWRPGSCGQVNEAVYEVKLVDDLDAEVPVGEVGEIVVRGREPFALTTGYYNFWEATVETFRNLWFHTGDLAKRDSDGYHFFVDRKKDSIRRRGENISAFDVETVLDSHPSVIEAAAVAVPSELGEDEIKACIVLQPGAILDPEELVAYCEERTASFMVPRYIEIRDSLPKTTTEKVEKYKLRAEGINGLTEDTWDRMAPT